MEMHLRIYYWAVKIIICAVNRGYCGKISANEYYATYVSYMCNIRIYL